MSLYESFLCVAKSRVEFGQLIERSDWHYGDVSDKRWIRGKRERRT
jgi:hypothetical protein